MSGVPVDVVVALLRAVDAEPPGDVRALLAAAGVADADAAVLDAEVRRLRAGAERWRRRGQELAALYSTARELAQLRDVDQLLDRLVERAHDLVGTDVTYLSEFDEQSRELRVRTTLGTVTPSFRGLRVPPGMGLASRVVEGRGPQWTADYAAMTQAPHEAGIDAAVAAEGLVSLLGVPLLAGDEVIGALFAANRVTHAFSPDEIALLTAFADHAAVVLQTARLLERTRSHVAAMERASGVHTDLTALVLEGGDAADVASALGRALGCRVTILDADLRRAHGAGAVTPDVRAAVQRSRSTGRCEPVGRGVAVAVVAGQTMLGALLLEEGDLAFGPVERRTAERAAQITALLQLKQDALVAAEQRVRGDLLADMLSADPQRVTGAARRARASGVALAELHSVVVLALPAEHRRSAARAVEPMGLVAEHGDGLVALTSHADPAIAARRLHAAVRRTVPAPVVAVGAAVADVPGDVRRQADAALGCARILPALGLADTAVTVDEYLPYTALFGPGEDRVAAFVRRMLGPVLDRDGPLLATLAAYLEHRTSPIATARALHVHKNTVLQRLEKLDELLGPDWQEPERLFRLGIAVRLARLGVMDG